MDLWKGKLNETGPLQHDLGNLSFLDEASGRNMWLLAYWKLGRIYMEGKTEVRTGEMPMERHIEQNSRGQMEIESHSVQQVDNYPYSIVLERTLENQGDQHRRHSCLKVRIIPSEDQLYFYPVVLFKQHYLLLSNITHRY